MLKVFAYGTQKDLSHIKKIIQSRINIDIEGIRPFTYIDDKEIIALIVVMKCECCFEILTIFRERFPDSPIIAIVDKSLINDERFYELYISDVLAIDNLEESVDRLLISIQNAFTLYRLEKKQKEMINRCNMAFKEVSETYENFEGTYCLLSDRSWSALRQEQRLAVLGY